MKLLKITQKTLKKLKEDIEKDAPDYITGTITEIKKLGLDQSSEVLGVKVKPDPEVIELKDFDERIKLDAFVRELLGDNITLNRLNSHILKGKKEDLDRLQLSNGSNIYGCSVKKDD